MNPRNTPENRYWISEPVRGGYDFFDVTDHKLDENVATIRQDVPGAGEIAELIAVRMEGKE